MRVALLVLALAAATSASAQATLDTSAVAAAAADPAVARCLAEVRKLDTALATPGSTAMGEWLSDDFTVNGPNNMIGNREIVTMLRAKGVIGYSRYVRRVEHLSRRADGTVLLMGQETVDPTGPGPLQGKRVERRFTDVWREDGGQWKTTLRQATIISMVPKP